jgi:hypothetical protein
MNEDLPDWSLFKFLDMGGKAISQAVGSQRDTDGRTVMSLLGVAIWACIAPIWLCGFIVYHGFQVSAKTWVYLVAMVVIVLVAMLK